MVAVSDVAQAEFDLNPDPRVLPMLGEINLELWRCIAELADNSVDGFLHAMRAGNGAAAPEVRITSPTTISDGALSRFIQQQAREVVEDTGNKLGLSRVAWHDQHDQLERPCADPSLDRRVLTARHSPRRER